MNKVFDYNDEIEIKLWDLHKKMSTVGATYLYVTTENSSGLRQRFTTLFDWMDIYYEENLISNDPLKRLARINSIVLWNKLSGLDKKGKMVMEARTENKMCNGLTIPIFSTSIKRHIVGIGTDTDDHDLSRYLLEEKNSLKKYISSILDILN